MLWAVKKKSWWARLDSQYGLRVHTVLINPCFISLKHHSKPHWWRRKWQPTPVFLSGKPPRTEGPGGLQFAGSQSRTQLSD